MTAHLRRLCMSPTERSKAGLLCCRVVLAHAMQAVNQSKTPQRAQHVILGLSLNPIPAPSVLLQA